MKASSLNTSSHPLLRTAAVQRLQSLVKSRFHKQMNLRFFIPLDTDSFSNSYTISNNHLIIPITNDGKFLALAEIEYGGFLDLKDQKTVSEMVKMVLEPQIYAWFLEQEKNNSRKYEEAVFSGPELETEPTPESMASLMILKTQKPELVQRTATNIHEISKRWALVNSSTLDRPFQSALDLLALNDITLLIQNYHTLSADQMGALTDYLVYCGKSAGPLVLVGHTEGSLNKDLMGYQIEIDRLPQDFRTRSEALELLLAPNESVFET